MFPSELQRTQLEIDKIRQAQADPERALGRVARLAAKLRDLGIDPDEV